LSSTICLDTNQRGVITPTNDDVVVISPLTPGQVERKEEKHKNKTTIAG